MIDKVNLLLELAVQHIPDHADTILRGIKEGVSSIKYQLRNIVQQAPEIQRLMDHLIVALRAVRNPTVCEPGDHNSPFTNHESGCIDCEKIIEYVRSTLSESEKVSFDSLSFKEKLHFCYKRLLAKVDAISKVLEGIGLIIIALNVLAILAGLYQLSLWKSERDGYNQSLNVIVEEFLQVRKIVSTELEGTLNQEKTRERLLVLSMQVKSRGKDLKLQGVLTAGLGAASIMFGGWYSFYLNNGIKIALGVAGGVNIVIGGVLWFDGKDLEFISEIIRNYDLNRIPTNGRIENFGI